MCVFGCAAEKLRRVCTKISSFSLLSARRRRGWLREGGRVAGHVSQPLECDLLLLLSRSPDPAIALRHARRALSRGLRNWQSIKSTYSPFNWPVIHSFPCPSQLSLSLWPLSAALCVWEQVKVTRF